MNFTSKFFIARIPSTNTEQDFGNKNSSIHELHKITRELKVTSFKFRFIPKARKIPHQQANHVLVVTSPAAKKYICRHSYKWVAHLPIGQQTRFWGFKNKLSALVTYLWISVLSPMRRRSIEELFSKKCTYQVETPLQIKSTSIRRTVARDFGPITLGWRNFKTVFLFGNAFTFLLQ